MHWSKVAPALTGNDVEGELRVKIGACDALVELGVLRSDRSWPARRFQKTSAVPGTV
jgi:hypothetical protein